MFLKCKLSFTARPMALILHNYNSTKASSLENFSPCVGELNFLIFIQEGKKKGEGKYKFTEKKNKILSISIRCKLHDIMLAISRYHKIFTQLQVAKHVIQRPQFSLHVSNLYN